MCKLVARLQIRFLKCTAANDHILCISSEWIWHCWFTNTLKPLTYAIKEDYYHTVRYLHENGADIHVDKGYALRLAAWFGNFQIVQYSHENGADIHAFDEYALQNAAQKNHYDIVRYLYENGADFDVAISNAYSQETKQKLETYKRQIKNV